VLRGPLTATAAVEAEHPDPVTVQNQSGCRLTASEPFRRGERPLVAGAANRGAEGDAPPFASGTREPECTYSSPAGTANHNEINVGRRMLGRPDLGILLLELPAAVLGTGDFFQFDAELRGKDPCD
jgi:hypothetical protein